MRLSLVLLFVLAASPVHARVPSQEDYDKQYTAEMAAVSPEAARLFGEGNAARHKNDHAAAAKAYEQAQALAPKLTHAMRRQAFEELSLGHGPRAIELMRKAVKQEESSANMTMLAVVLSMRKDSTAAERAEAVTWAMRSTTRDPDDTWHQAALCQVALAAERGDVLAGCSAKLAALAPNEMSTHYFGALSHALGGDFNDALAALGRARALGLPEPEYQRLDKAMRDARPLHQAIGPPALWVLVIWLVAMVVLVLGGLTLSAATLRASRRVPSSASARPSGGESLLRRVYAGVIWLCCIYYYVSIPITGGLVVLVGGGLIYACFALGSIPIKLVLLVGLLVLVSVGALLKSLFAFKRDQSDPGRKLDLSEQPALRALLDEVAARIGTRPVDSVYLTPGADMAVVERGGLLAKASGRSERCLILGVAVLEGFPLAALRAVLAHEYGHFVNRDTAGGGFAMAVRRSLLNLAVGLAQGGAAAWFNPAWLFVNGFYRVFLRVSQGASRLQEVLADRWAAMAYGAQAFEVGLRHVITADARFREHAEVTIDEVFQEKQPLQNLYTYVPKRSVDAKKLEEVVNEELNRAPSPYDSHPAPRDRIAWVHALPAGPACAATDDADAWSLFGDRARIEHEMTAEIRDRMLASGYSITG